MAEELPPLLTTERVKFLKKTDSKKRIIETLAELLASGQKDVTQHQIFDALIAREKLGNTVVGNGIAIPRARLDIVRPRAALVYLKKGIRLDAPDKKPVHLFIAILIPDNETDKYTSIIKQLNIDLAEQTPVSEISENKNPQILVDLINELINSHQQSKEAN